MCPLQVTRILQSYATIIGIANALRAWVFSSISRKLFCSVVFKSSLPGCPKSNSGEHCLSFRELCKLHLAGI